MVTGRKLDAPMYIVAFILTLIMFGFGFFLGSIYTNSTLSDISDDVNALNNKIRSSQLLFLLDQNDTSFCPLYIDELNKIDAQIITIGNKLEILEESKVYDDDLKNQYFVVETESYLLSKQVNERCNQDILLVLYFYSNDDCSNCKKQGEELSKARIELNKERETIKTYSFDGTLGSSVVDSFIKKYKIDSYPSIVFENKVLEGYKSKDELISEFKN